MKRGASVLLVAGFMYTATALAQLQPLPSNPSNPAGGRPLWVTQQLNYRQQYLSDEKFISSAAISNNGALEMGRLAADKASDPKIREYAKQMVRERTRTNKDLRQLAESRKVMMPVLPSPEDQRELRKLQGKSGKDFDKSYVKAMREDRDQTLALYTNAAQSSSIDPELRVYADEKLPMVEASQRQAHALKPTKHNDEASPGINEGYSAQSLSPTPEDE